MSDLVIFVALVGVLLAVGIAVGMIVAGRLDRLMAAREQTAAVEADARTDAQADALEAAVQEVAAP